MISLSKVLSTALTIILGAYSGVAWALGDSLPSWHRFFVTFTPLVITIAVPLWNHVLWKLPPVRKALQRPLISGNWWGHVIPHTDSSIPADGNRGPIETIVSIKQSFFRTSVLLRTEESQSVSLNHSWSFDPAGTSDLTYTFENSPCQDVAHRSPRSIGTATFKIYRMKPNRIDATYFNERLTKGTMQLKKMQNNEAFDSFEDARELAVTEGLIDLEL